MSTPDQPDRPPLTRRRLREIRNTGSTPVVPFADDTSAEAPAPVETPAPAPAPLPRAAAPAPVPPAPEPPADLGVSPLTRRQARAQERIRTASVPVITPDDLAAAAPAAPAEQIPAPEAPAPEPEPQADAKPAESAPEKGKRKRKAKEKAAASAPAVIVAVPADAQDDDARAAEPAVAAPDDRAEPVTAASDADEQGDQDAPAPALVHPALGSELLAGETPAVTLPPSFDQLITRSGAATGSVSTPNALILSQTPTGAPLVAPVTATGEILITGSFDLPDGLGSVGHAPGATDGKDLDVALIDGELPPASSPTPIAASAAISTVRNSGEEIIRPPAPEKGSRLMLALVITAGVLALALAGVLILAISTGRI